MRNRLFVVVTVLGLSLAAVLPAMAQDSTPEKSVYVVPREMTIYELTQGINICFEDLLPMLDRVPDAWGNKIMYISEDSRISYETDHALCYDEEGNRIGYDDQAVHITSGFDSLYTTATEYGVCVQDLYDANPSLDLVSPYLKDAPIRKIRNGWVLFIPNVPPCSDPIDPRTKTIEHVAQNDETYEHLIFLYNVCINRILDVNLHLRLRTNEELSLTPYTRYANYDTGDNSTLFMPRLQPGMVVRIPINRLPCFYGMSGPQRYICYDQQIDFTENYRGHEPPISPVERGEVEVSDPDHCYPLANPATPIIYENELVWRVYTRSMPVERAANCFGADVTEIYEANGWSNRANGEYADFWQIVGVGYIIPNATDTCGIEDINDYISFDMDDVMLTTVPGTFDGRAYTVDYGDTLSGIAKQTGYHPQQLKWHNPVIQDADIIQTYHQIKLPPYPSFYHLGGIVSGGLLVLGVFSGVRRQRLGRGKKKRG